MRDIPTPVGPDRHASRPARSTCSATTTRLAAIQNVALEFEYYQGDTVFKPPEYEFRFTPVFNANYVKLEEINGVNVDPRDGRTRADDFVGIQAAFVDKHLRNVSDRFDFDSIRVGIQPFSSDFRGFLFQDNQLGVRLFGNRRNNVVQYNLAWFRRIEKDTNSGLNDSASRCATTTSSSRISTGRTCRCEATRRRSWLRTTAIAEDHGQPLRSERFHRSPRIDWPWNARAVTTLATSDTTATDTSDEST